MRRTVLHATGIGACHASLTSLAWQGVHVSLRPPQGSEVLSARPRQACDAFGNLRRSGGDGFQAAVRGSPGAARVEDRCDGTYAVTYTLPAEGEYQVAVTGPDGRHVRGSPVALTVFRCYLAVIAPCSGAPCT